MDSEGQHLIDVLGLAQERVAEILNEAWDGEKEISKDQVVIHLVVDGDSDDPFIYTSSVRPVNESIEPELRKRLALALAQTGEELLDGLPT